VKIAIDTSPLSSGHSYRGIGTYTRLLIKALKASDVEVVETPTPFRSDADVVHFPYFDLFFLTLPLMKPLPTVVTIHDVIPLAMASNYPPGLRGRLKFGVQKSSLLNASMIVTDSKASSGDVVTYLKQPTAKVKTVYLAANPELKPASLSAIKSVKDRYSLNKPYLLYVGDINYNKNLPGLLAAVARVDGPFELVMVSRSLRRDNPAAKFLWQTIDKLELASRIKVLTDVPADPEIISSLYSGALFYIQPSFLEGFGLPVLEAQVCGCPVISSTGGSLTEVVGESGISFDPNLNGAVTNALKKAVDLSPDQRSKLIEAGFANAGRFSWQKTALAMKKVYSLCAR
jgi:glycosyltransferase involved in cell wall biosynthesis